MIQRHDDPTNEGGSYLLTSRWVHDLPKFFAMPTQEKSEIIGRDYTKFNEAQKLRSPGRLCLCSFLCSFLFLFFSFSLIPYSFCSFHILNYLFSENPLLMEEKIKMNAEEKTFLPRSHIQRGYGALYRQAYPYFTTNEKGLYFLAFSSFLSQIEEALHRMAGHFAEDGSKDDIFKFTHVVATNYYYCPSVPQLNHLLSLFPQ